MRYTLRRQSCCCCLKWAGGWYIWSLWIVRVEATLDVAFVRFDSPVTVLINMADYADYTRHISAGLEVCSELMQAPQCVHVCVRQTVWLTVEERKEGRKERSRADSASQYEKEMTGRGRRAGVVRVMARCRLFSAVPHDQICWTHIDLALPKRIFYPALCLYILTDVWWDYNILTAAIKGKC